MCNSTGVDFVAEQFRTGKISGADILEVGSCDFNGGVRDLAKVYEPASYVGVDLTEGPGVDVVCSAEDLVARFGPESFDWVVSTEMLEHVPDWKAAVNQLKQVLRPGGRLVLTTRSPGFRLHGYPADFWRFTPEDMHAIFADMDGLEVVSDRPEPGVFVAGSKSGRARIPLDAISVFSMVTRTRRSNATAADVWASKQLVTAKRGSLKVGRKVLPRRARALVRKFIG